MMIWETEKLPSDGTWCWITCGERAFIAMRDTQSAGGWTNEDTWEDFNHQVVAWIPIEEPPVFQRTGIAP
jgi:hypothetical protein